MWLQLLDQLLLLRIVIMPAAGQTLHSTLFNEMYACPGQNVTFTCKTNGSLIVAWSSDEYIGPEVGRQLEVTIEEREIASMQNPNTIARVVRDNGMKIIESTLSIIVDHKFPNASIKCADVERATESVIQFQIFALPGLPLNVTAERITPLKLDCVIIVQWDQPSNSEASYVDHYNVSFPSGSARIPTAISILVHLCEIDIDIKISAVDLCGREGPSTGGILANFLDPTAMYNHSETGNIAANAGTTMSCDSCTVNVAAVAVLSVLLAICILLIIIILGLLISIKVPKSKDKSPSGGTESDKEEEKVVPESLELHKSDIKEENAYKDQHESLDQRLGSDAPLVKKKDTKKINTS